MTIKSFEPALMELSYKLVFEKAKLIDNEYKLDISELNLSDKIEFMNKFFKIYSNIDTHIQEYLNDACQDRMYAESQPFGDWDE